MESMEVTRIWASRMMTRMVKDEEERVVQGTVDRVMVDKVMVVVVVQGMVVRDTVVVIQGMVGGVVHSTVVQDTVAIRVQDTDKAMEAAFMDRECMAVVEVMVADMVADKVADKMVGTVVDMEEVIIKDRDLSRTQFQSVEVMEATM